MIANSSTNMWLALKRAVCACLALKRAVIVVVHCTVVPQRPRADLRSGGGGTSSPSLSDDAASTCLFFVLATDGRGVVMS